MKNVLIKCLAAAMLLLSGASAHAAANPARVVSGDKSAFKVAAPATVVFDYSQSKVISKKGASSWAEFYAEKKEDIKWVNIFKASEKNFVSKFNKKVKGLQLMKSGEADYTVTVSINRIELGDTGASLLSHVSILASSKTGGSSLSGAVTVKDKSGKELCRIEFENARGMGGLTMLDRFLDAMSTLPGYLAKALK